MKSKKLLIGFCVWSMLFSANTLSYAKTISDTNVDMSEFQEEFMSSLTEKDYMASDPEFISFDEYLIKYGEENVIEGFNIAEAGNRAGIYGLVDKEVFTESDNLNLTTLNIPNSLFENLSTGQFLGKEVLGVSDIPPNDTRFSVQLDDTEYSKTPVISSIDTNDTIEEMGDSIMSATSTHNQSFSYNGIPYKLLWYGDGTPNHNWIKKNLCSSTHGSFAYKYSYADSYGYACTSDIDFSSTTIKGGSELVNMYAYIAAQGSALTLDFGFITNPYSLNDGFHAYYNFDGDWVVDAWPKFSATWTNGVATYSGSRVKLMLDVEPDATYLYIYRPNTISNKNVIYYKAVTTTGGHLVPTSDNLSFIQAMTCPRYDVDDGVGTTTNLSSGAYFENVKFRNTKVLRDGSYGGDFNLPAYGPNTRYVYINKPSKITFTPSTDTPSSTYDNISINYK